jgi:fatty-acyl-CoA synthase
MSEILIEPAIQVGAPSAKASSARAWMRALELTAPIAKHRERILPTVIQEMAVRQGEAPALLSDRESLSYRALAERANQYARWALAQGLAKGDVVCLLMPNRPEYMAIWLGITSVGAAVSLLNTNLIGPSLAHCICAVSPKHTIASAEFEDVLNVALTHLAASGVTPKIWMHGAADPVDTVHERIDIEISRFCGEPLSGDERRGTVIDDLALYIYTSGTTGLPKAARVSHARVMQWSHWFAGIMEVGADDRMYNCLPMYHSVGGVQAPGAVLVAGGSVVLREKFSASQFWNDVVRWDCTLFQYIGELCRYLLHTGASERETEHRIRLACGNGLAPEIWDAFKERFGIPRILEFYAATEGNISLFNVEGKRGAIGQIPSYLAHRFSPALVLFDFETGRPVRDERGFCVRCAANQVGEALGKIAGDVSNSNSLNGNASNIGGRFEGYTRKEDSEKKILRDVFELGDAWFRTGDLMRKDEKGSFYFVDRIGDTFRRKGENVATSEVSEAICEFPGVRHANVYGVAVPGTEGRVGMAMVVAEDEIDMAAFHQHLTNRLPSYARPLFLRIRGEADLTGTFKYSKTELVRQGYDPAASADPVYFDLQDSLGFVRLDKDLYDRIQDGEIRL